MKNRITELFESKKEKILSLYFTAGFPQRNDTIEIARALELHGADMMEIGIPFSDPVADGPVIQQSNKVALANGMNVALLLDQVQEMRKHLKIPIILMGYLNPIMQYGISKFLARAKEVGVDGLIVPDWPLDEYVSVYKAKFEELGLLHALLVSPTTSEERIRRIDTASSGFLYAVSSSSTTGARKEFGKEQLSYFKYLNELKLKNPFMVGFGISNAHTFNQACKYSRGAIIGSAFVSALEKGRDLDDTIGEFTKAIRGK